MDLPITLIHQLDSILHPLVPHPDGLSATANALVESLATAVSSFRGLDLRVTHAGQRVTLTAFDKVVAGQIATSLRWRLNGHDQADPDQLILYAGRTGAFVDLAADLRYALVKKSPHMLLQPDLELDQDLPPRTTTTGLTGLSELSLLNRAAGVLIDRGASPRDALTELDRQALLAGVDRYAYARELLKPRGEPDADRS